MAITYGIDLTTATAYNYATDFLGSFITPLYVVGTQKNKRSFSEIEFCLAKELATSEGIKFEYRVNLTDSFTTIKKSDGSTLTLTYAILGAVTSHIIAADIPACEMLQVRVSFVGSATTTPRFKYLTIR